MFGLGWMELLIILVVVMLLFGAGRITSVMKDMGKGVTAFKDGMREGDLEKDTPKKVKKK